MAEQTEQLVDAQARAVIKTLNDKIQDTRDRQGRLLQALLAATERVAAEIRAIDREQQAAARRGNS